jgi:hypothetical protein
MSGDLIDHLTGKARIPGWWDPDEEKWYEDEYQVSTHTGNLAWVMIALLNYYKKEGGSQYLMVAQTLGEWIETESKDIRGPGGLQVVMRVGNRLNRRLTGNLRSIILISM